MRWQERRESWQNGLYELPGEWLTPAVPCTLSPGEPAEAGAGELPFLVPLMGRRQRAVFWLLCLLWAGCVATFWWWWLRPEHELDAFRFVASSVVMFWTTLTPAYFLLAFSRARVANPAVPLPAGWRVAMVVTKAPSEPFSVVRVTLQAMLAQAYLHDTWLADEDPDAETLAWCAQHGVRVSTRKGVAAYHNASWPRRTRCKEGNLAYFYDHYGYGHYDVVAQMDADHVPAPGYLEAMLRPFVDPCVGYVSAPSICDSNAADSWAARGRLYAEGALHGALQAGYSGGLAPLCIGSHYAVRLSALRDIGGLGPELAEDHSTTLMMNARGWRGVHALDAIAHGEGPPTFAVMATQEYQWSKSLAMILFRYTRRFFAGLSLRLKAQFLFMQLWYTLFSLSMAITVVMPVVALLTHRVWVNVSYPSYFLFSLLIAASLFVLMNWIRRTRSFRPYDARTWSWEVVAFNFARWPWSLLGTLSAAFDCLRGREYDFKVTPKSATGVVRLPPQVIQPYLLISLFCSLPVLLVGQAGEARGFYLLSLFNALAYLLLAGLIVVRHAREQGLDMQVPQLLLEDGPVTSRRLFSAAALVCALGIGTHLPGSLAALLWHPGAAQIWYADAAEHPPLELGVYDPGHVFPDHDRNVSIEHLFVSWADPAAQAAIVAGAEEAHRHGRRLMVTVEPWPAVGLTRATLLRDIAAGRYDATIAPLCQTLADGPAPVLVRFAHEMETPTGRYPWAGHDGAAFVAAYRHFVASCRHVGGTSRFVWSPRGDRALSAFYPGRDVVDVIGLSVFDCPECGESRSATRQLQEKYRRVADFGQPVLVAELGVTGNAGRRVSTLRELRQASLRLPLLTGLVYFNARDSAGAWPTATPPDWRITPPMFSLSLSASG